MTVKPPMPGAGAHNSRHACADADVPSVPSGARAGAVWARVASAKSAMAGRRARPAWPGSCGSVDSTEPVAVSARGLAGRLQLPRDARALVLFVDTGGAGGHRRSDSFVEQVLHRHGLGSLHVDFLDHLGRFDSRHVGLLASRVGWVLGWIGRRRDLAALPIGLMAADAGAAAAMVAAALRSEVVGALVSRSGHPELAAGHLACVAAPTLLIVGGADRDAQAANRAALGLLACNKRLEVLPGATSRFEEPGALESVAELTVEWFDRHLARRTSG